MYHPGIIIIIYYDYKNNLTLGIFHCEIKEDLLV